MTSRDPVLFRRITRDTDERKWTFSDKGSFIVTLSDGTRWRFSVFGKEILTEDEIRKRGEKLDE